MSEGDKEMGDEERIRGRVSNLEKRAAELLEDGKRDKALGRIDRAMEVAEELDDRAYSGKLMAKYASIETGGNPYKDKDWYLHSFFILGAFALGGILLFTNITGNVTGWADIGSGLLGAVLFAVGVVGALVLIKKSR